MDLDQIQIINILSSWKKMKIGGRPSGREIWENGTVLTAKSGDIATQAKWPL